MLFEEMRIGSLAARNRVVRAATAESIATSDGRPTPRLQALYEELADGGVGTIITGYAYVRDDGKPSEGALGMHDDVFVDDYRALVDAVHGRGARIVAQLVYGGSKSKIASADILGASPIENPKTGIVPREASADDLRALAEAFGLAAARAQRCGFDGVEAHVAHGYLLSQFLSGRFNIREDAYGGSLENRARFAIECVRAVRNAVGTDYPVIVKVNSCDDLDDPAGVRGGLGEDESAAVCRLLVKAGANCIDVSGDWHAASSRDSAGEPFFAGFGARLARELDVPIIVTGGWRNLDVIEQHLATDGIAGIGLCRPLICEPDLIARWQSGDTASSKCIGCGQCAKQPGIPCALR